MIVQMPVVCREELYTVNKKNTALCDIGMTHTDSLSLKYDVVNVFHGLLLPGLVL